MRRPSNYAAGELKRLLLDDAGMTPEEFRTFLRDNGYKTTSNQIDFSGAPDFAYSRAIDTLAGIGDLTETFFELLSVQPKLLKLGQKIARLRVAFDIDPAPTTHFTEARMDKLAKAAAAANLQKGAAFAKLVTQSPHELRMRTSGPEGATREWVDALFRAANRQFVQPGDAEIWMVALLRLCVELTTKHPGSRAKFEKALAEVQIGYIDDSRVGEPLLALGGSVEAIVIEGGFMVDAGAMDDWLGKARSRTCLVRVGGEDRGTGILVGSDLVLTNWHVIAPVIKGSVSLGKPIGGTVAASTVRFVFDYTTVDGKEANTTEAKLAGADAADGEERWLLDWTPAADVELKENPDPPSDHPTNAYELDFALVRLERAVAGEGSAVLPKRGYYKITNSVFGFDVGVPIVVAGHPVTLMNTGTIYSTKKQAKRLVCSIAGRASLGVNPNGPRVRYRTNTNPGSSGSPVFSDAFELVALHHFGYEGRYNQGIPIAAIHNRLERADKLEQLGY